jgi:hypothetical protein
MWTDCFHFAAALLLVLSLSPCALCQEDILDLSAGAVVLSASDYYNDQWHPLLLLDGTITAGWCNGENSDSHTILIELARAYSIYQFVIDNTGAQEEAYAGISARGFKLYASTDPDEEGYELVLTGEAEQGARRVFVFEAPFVAQWIRLEITSNYGNEEYIELMELDAFGSPTGPEPDRPAVDGVFDTNHGLLWLQDVGGRISGCYDEAGGWISGSGDGRTLKLQWEQDGPAYGTAAFVLSTDGGYLTGFWYQDGQFRGLWHGPRVTNGREPKCKQ